MGQEPRISLAGWFCLMGFWSRCWPGLWSSEDLTWAGGSVSKVARTHTGCWQEVSVPCHVDLPIRLECPLMTWQLASSIVSDLRESKVEIAMSFMKSYSVLFTISYVVHGSVPLIVVRG